MLVALLLPGFGSAQLRDRTEHKPVGQEQTESKKKPAKRGPRAIAVVEFLPGGGARLIPIALWINDRFYDASLYGANPEPMALQPETLYQATNYGEPTGWFTVTTPKQVNGNWVADGQWKPQKGSLDTKIAEQAAKQAKKKSPSLMSDDSGPPVLRRSPASGSEPEPSGGNQSSTPSSTSSSSPPPSDDDPDRPTLKNSSPSAAASSSQPTLADDTPQANVPPASASSPDDNDPDRPILHRGKPAAQSGTTAAAIAAPKPSASKTASPAAAAPALKASANAPRFPQSGHAYPAISDAGTYEMRSLLYAMTPAEKEDKAQPMLALAMEEVRNYVGKHTVASPTKTPAKVPPKASAKPQSFVITDYDLRAFDLDFSNSPTFVLTAKVPSPTIKPAAGAEFDYFVTVVARLDINGQAQKIFSSVTDSTHLDAYPQLEVIDAVDADANGRGDLLFRQHSDIGISYALYRVYPYQMVKVFEGGAGM
jgi:hypothetical protein